MMVTIDKLVHGGQGMADALGKKVFVPYSAPGDSLEVEVVAEHAGFLDARIVEILNPAPCRVAPRCPVFGECGGCQWQHLDYESQIVWKREIVREVLVRIGKLRDPEVLPTVPSPKRWNYRNRMQLHVDSRGRVGYYRPRSKEVVEFESCAIAADGINEELALRREEISGRDRGIALRAGGGEGFLQVNSEQNENLRGILAQWLGRVPHERVIELHAGSGNFTFAMAAVAGQIVATEIDGRAVEAAREAQGERGTTNVQFRRCDALRAVKRFGQGSDAIVLDPPRKGCPEAIEAIAEAAPASVIYVSCDPATLARDVRRLCQAGYGLELAQPVDMFPQTFHVETVCMLLRR